MSRLVLVETVFTPRMVVVATGGLPRIQGWVARHPGLAAGLEQAGELVRYPCGHLVDPGDPVGFALRRSETWWDLRRWASERGWRLVRLHGWVEDGLPVWLLCSCGGC